MSRKQVDTLLLGMSIAAYFAMSASFLLMPVKNLRLLAGVMFWLGLPIGLSLQIVLEIRRRIFFARYHVRRQRMQKPRNGLLTFCSNRGAKIADITLAISAVCLILSCLVTRSTGYLCYVFIAATTFALCMHCILNGRIYFYVNNQYKIKQVLEQKKIRSFRKERVRNV